MALLGEVFYTYYVFTKRAPSKTNFDSNKIFIHLFYLITINLKYKLIDYKDVFVMRL